MAQRSGKVTRVENPAVGDGAPTSSGPTVSKARGFSKRQERLIEDNRNDYSALGPAEGGVGTPYPMRLVPHDKYDNIVELKSSVREEVLGKKQLTTDDLEWLQRKQEAQNAATYKQYASQIFDLKNPAEVKILNKIHPEFVAEKEEIIDQRKEMLKTLAHIRLRGFPESREELELLYAIGSGNVAPPEGTLWNPESWAKPQGAAGAIERGIFNPTKLFAKVTSQGAFDIPRQNTTLTGVVNAPSLQQFYK